MVITKTHKQIKEKSIFNKTFKNINKNNQLIPTIYDNFNNIDNIKIFSNKINSTNLIIKKKIFLNDLKRGSFSTNFSPKNDFYSYINETWLNTYKTNKKLSYLVQIDDFRLVQDKVYHELLDIVENYIKHPPKNEIKKAHLLDNYYTSFKIMNTRTQSQKYTEEAVKFIDECIELNNPWRLLAFFNRNEIISWGCPFIWTLNPDDKNPNIYRCYLDGPQTSLIDIDVYFDDGKDITYKQNYRNRFNKYLHSLFFNVFGNNSNNITNDKNKHIDYHDIFLVEQKILNTMGCEKIKNTDKNNYNIIKTDEALTDYGFDWKAFTTEIGFKNTPTFFITSNPNYLKCGGELFLKEWNTPQWRTYWIYLFIRQQQRFDDYGRINFYDFFGLFMRGQQSIVSVELQPIFSLGFAFNTFLTNNYIKKYENIVHLQYVKKMAEDLKNVFISIVKENKWLQPHTKKKALEKLHKFDLVIGSPKVLRTDPLLDYTANDAWGNLVKMSLWRNKKAILLEGQHIIDIPAMDWSQIPPKFIGTQAYVVNAAYTPSKNNIYIPLGYIQKPFIDLDERGIEYNLAHIGFTLAHEMSHSLDDWGSQYDSNGCLNNWWTDADRSHFKKIQNDVIKQYETFAKYDGIIFDASPSIGEDLADISGLSICQEYLNKFQSNNEDILEIKKLSHKAFFTYFAYQQRQQIEKRAIQAQLKTNPHPLDKYRTNIPLSRSQLFRTIYNIKKKDLMWWHSTNRVWE